MPREDARFFAPFASGCLGWLLLGWIFAPAGTVCVSLRLHFEFFVSLLDEPEAPGARHGKSLKKVKMETTRELKWEPSGTRFGTVAS